MRENKEKYKNSTYMNSTAVSKPSLLYGHREDSTMSGAVAIDYQKPSRWIHGQPMDSASTGILQIIVESLDTKYEKFDKKQ